MIIGECNLHHGSSDDSTIFNHWSQIGRVHAQNRTLRWVHNRCRQHRAEDTSIRHCECATRHMLRCNFTISGQYTVVVDVLFNVCNCFLLYISYNWYHETFRTTDCHSDVVVVAVHYFVIFNC